MASASASSSTIPPRPALISRRPGFACASTAAFDESDRLRRLGRVDRDEVGGREQFLDRRNELHADLPGALGVHERVEGDEPHAERRGRAGRRARRPARGRRCRASCRGARRPPTATGSTCRRVRSVCACGTLRACASSSAIVCSAAERMFDCGAFTTITPRRVASATSTLSRPIPARPTTTRSLPGLEHVGGRPGSRCG